MFAETLGRQGCNTTPAAEKRIPTAVLWNAKIRNLNIAKSYGKSSLTGEGGVLGRFASLDLAVIDLTA